MPSFDYAAILDEANDTIMIRDLNDSIIYWNQGAERLYGWTKKEVLGKNVHRLLKTVFPEGKANIFERFFKSSHWEGFLHHSKKDGSRITVASRWTLQRTKGGKPLAYLEINNDVTQQKRIEAELQKAHKELERRVAERTAQLKRTNEALRDLSLRLISAQESERTRISRDLHDDLGQTLTYVNLDLERALVSGGERKKNALIRKALEVNQNLHVRLKEISTLLRPPVLDDLGMKAAVESYVTEFSQRTGIASKCDVRLNGGRLEETLATAMYRIMQEALTNVVKHAEAGKISIMLQKHEDRVSLKIEDNGKGFHIEKIYPPGGLSGMKERAELMGGRFAMKSVVGKGTSITVVIPTVK